MTDILIPLPQYEFWFIGAKTTASALKIKHIFIVEHGVELHFEDERFAPTLMDGAWADLMRPIPGQYLIFFGSEREPACMSAGSFEEIFTPVEDSAQ